MMIMYSNYFGRLCIRIISTTCNKWYAKISTAKQKKHAIIENAGNNLSEYFYEVLYMQDERLQREGHSVSIPVFPNLINYLIKFN